MMTGGTPTVGNLHFIMYWLAKKGWILSWTFGVKNFYERSESYDVLQWIRMQWLDLELA